MALTANQERLLAEMIHIRVNSGNVADIIKLVRQIRTVTEPQLVAAIKAHAAARRDALVATQTTEQADINFYTQEAL